MAVRFGAGHTISAPFLHFSSDPSRCSAWRGSARVFIHIHVHAHDSARTALYTPDRRFVVRPPSSPSEPYTCHCARCLVIIPTHCFFSEPVAPPVSLATARLQSDPSLSLYRLYLPVTFRSVCMVSDPTYMCSNPIPDAPFALTRSRTFVIAFYSRRHRSGWFPCWSNS